MVAAVAEPEDLQTCWTERERKLWEPVERIKVSAWAERDRRIVSKDAAEPGAWKNSRAPYTVEIADTLSSDDPTREVVWVKPARVGGTELGNNAIGCWAKTDPAGAVGLVYPTEADAKEQLRDEIGPILGDLGEALDLKNAKIELGSMNIYAAWAPSPAKLARRTFRRAIGDEVDKWPRFAGRDASPIALLRRRLQTWGAAAKLYLTSTPTTKDGAIWLELDSCTDRRYWFAPCACCGAMQRMTLSVLRWPTVEGLARDRLADKIEAEDLAWIECSSCGGKTLERDKYDVMNRGRWLAEDASEPPVFSLKKGYQGPPAFCSQLGVTISGVAAQYLRALAAKDRGDIGPLYEFVTQVLGEAFEEVQGRVSDKLLEEKRLQGHKPGIVPAWAGVLLSIADTQKDTFVWATFAFGRERIRMIDRGRADTRADLLRATRDARYKIEDTEDERLGPVRLFIDAGGGGEGIEIDGSRTEEVYQLAAENPAFVRPLKGWGGDGLGPRDASLVSPRRVNYKPRGEKRSPYDVDLLMLDTQALKDILAAWLQVMPATHGWERFQLSEDIDAEFVREATSERKVAEREGSIMVARWRRVRGRRGDWWDVLVYAVAAGKVERVDTLPDEDELRRAREEAPKLRANPPRPPEGISKPDGRPFISRRGTR